MSICVGPTHQDFLMLAPCAIIGTPERQAMRPFLAAIIGAAILSSFVLPAAAQSVSLKCTWMILKIGATKRAPDYYWLTINPASDFGVASWINGRGEETSVKATQFITPSQYILKHVDSEMFGWTRTWTVDRATGKMLRTQAFTNPSYNQEPIVDTGTCKKTAPKKVMF